MSGIEHIAGSLVDYGEFMLPYAWALLLTYVLAQPLADAENRRYCVSVYRRIRPRGVALNVTVLAVTISLYVLLVRILPWLNYSWISAVVAAGSGQAQAGGTNPIAAPLFLPLIGPMFAALLLFCLPLLTRAEERAFRRGTRSMVHAVPRSLVFGLAHCIVGVPLAAGLAISVPGMWFSYVYLTAERSGKDGVETAAIAHTTANAVLILFIGSLLLLLALA